MPRLMPALVQGFQKSCDDACRLALAGETVRALGGIAQQEVTLPRLEYLYEIAFLRIFIAWENFVEESFLRYLCGFRTSSTQAPQRLGGASPCKTLQIAHHVLYQHQKYLLWHNPAKVISRSQLHFTSGPHETVILSNQARMDWFANVRHRVAHGQFDARQNFDTATMGLVGRRYPGGRAGRFLRDRDPTQQLPTRWIQSIAGELESLAAQVVPP